MPLQDTDPEYISVEERRGLQRRADELQTQANRLEMRVAILEAKVDGLVTTIKSNYESMEKGYQLIMGRLDQLVPQSTLMDFKASFSRAEQRLNTLETLKNQMVGAFTLIMVLGVSGIIGGILAIVKAVKGP